MPGKKVILIVDDESSNIRIIGDILSGEYDVRVATSGIKALHTIKTGNQIDLILLDVMMPEMDGYELLQTLGRQSLIDNIPVIFVTAMDDTMNEEKGFKLGASDYISKPVNPAILKSRIKTHLHFQAMKDKLQDLNYQLKDEVDKKNIENKMLQRVSMRALSSLAKTRDKETNNHFLRIQSYIQVLARNLAKKELFKNVLHDSYINTMMQSASIHDIGRVGIPDYILHKSGPLTDSEYNLMKEHTKLGAESLKDCLKDSVSYLEKNFLTTAIEMTYYHHEKWNGEGYPQGLKGEDIPLCARLMALVDVFDALISQRCYKPAFSLEKSIDIIHSERGNHFQPEIVDAFDETLDEFINIINKFSDNKPQVVH